MKKILFAVLFLASLNGAQAADAVCAGTEPFWNLSISGDTLAYASPDKIEGVKLKIVKSQEAAGAPAGLATVVKTKHTSLTIVRGADCTDGMSDATYTHHAVYEIDGTVLYGCCDLK